ncbi:hypothetical protein PENANT_c002G00127 [Penicillium antarcticum]|uniref:Uncharacterized protein n=1 Tax=Penicillium antarcticum TaxID=416450 RepID=A0A1V6QKJ0_9EURO|nr:uncharacterized protein N7508_008684 [Penicillium antarcticum]KAJ5293863.1 hypothetical protein N7508_008684 [Penicillium antarcticum]OQD89715.1 hypothetical protein PENANT_c002G00127 [Penicillium antarcticum]
MSADKNSSLYGQRRQKAQSNETTSSNLAFASQLSSLISQDSNSTSARGRQRPSKNPKSDIFSKHNKGSLKRAAADLADDNRALKQVHKSSKDLGDIDASALGRSRRRMDEKARIYDDMKKGHHLAEDSDDDDQYDPSQPEDYLARLRRKEREGLVDFDRKHADEEENDQDLSDDENTSIISYEDEFGRTRRGTRAEAAEASNAIDEANGGRVGQERWRPARPENLIYGAAVQAEAFNPDATIVSHMSHLASRRDRSATPPEQKHYDADWEVRNRGTGFYAFSTNEKDRAQQMEELSRVREETLNKRKSNKERLERREATIKWRLERIEELKNKKMAAKFMTELETTIVPTQPAEQVKKDEQSNNTEPAGNAGQVPRSEQTDNAE